MSSGLASWRCWVEEANIAELGGLLREDLDGRQLRGWRASMRIFARRERPHPGAQLTLGGTACMCRTCGYLQNRVRGHVPRRHAPKYPYLPARIEAERLSSRRVSGRSLDTRFLPGVRRRPSLLERLWLCESVNFVRVHQHLAVSRTSAAPVMGRAHALIDSQLSGRYRSR